ncbi:autophagy protein 16 [Pelomyxa schiedti]|nr:autophagy protein 16 [Pelomyxa schiedti]
MNSDLAVSVQGLAQKNKDSADTLAQIEKNIEEMKMQKLAETQFHFLAKQDLQLAEGEEKLLIQERDNMREENSSLESTILSLSTENVAIRQRLPSLKSNPPNGIATPPSLPVNKLTIPTSQKTLNQYDLLLISQRLESLRKLHLEPTIPKLPSPESHISTAPNASAPSTTIQTTAPTLNPNTLGSTATSPASISTSTPSSSMPPTTPTVNTPNAELQNPHKIDVHPHINVTVPEAPAKQVAPVHLLKPVLHQGRLEFSSKRVAVADVPCIPKVLLEGHLGNIRSLVYSRNGEFLVSGSVDKTISLWPLNKYPSGEISRVKTLTGTLNSINGVEISADNTHVLGCSNDKSVRLWSLTSEKTSPAATFCGHMGKVYQSIFTRNRNIFVSGDSEGTSKVWDIETRRCISTAIWSSAVIGQCCIQEEPRLILSVHEDKCLRRWDISNGKCVNESFLPETPLSVCVSPNGNHALAACLNDTVLMIDLQNSESKPIAFKHPELHRPRSVCCSPSGQCICTMSQNGSLFFWDVASGEFVGLAPVDPPLTQAGIVSWNPHITNTNHMPQIASSYNNAILLWSPQQLQALGLIIAAMGKKKSKGTLASDTPSSSKAKKSHQPQQGGGHGEAATDDERVITGLGCYNTPRVVQALDDLVQDSLTGGPGAGGGMGWREDNGATDACLGLGAVSVLLAVASHYYPAKYPDIVPALIFFVAAYLVCVGLVYLISRCYIGDALLVFKGVGPLKKAAAVSTSMSNYSPDYTIEFYYTSQPKKRYAQTCSITDWVDESGTLHKIPFKKFVQKCAAEFLAEKEN